MLRLTRTLLMAQRRGTLPNRLLNRTQVSKFLPRTSFIYGSITTAMIGGFAIYRYSSTASSESKLNSTISSSSKFPIELSITAPDLSNHLKIGSHCIPLVIEQKENDYPTKKELECAFNLAGGIESAKPIVFGIRIYFDKNMEESILENIVKKIKEREKIPEKIAYPESWHCEPRIEEDDGKIGVSAIAYSPPVYAEKSIVLFFSKREKFDPEFKNINIEKYIPESIHEISHLIKAVSPEGITGMTIIFKNGIGKIAIEKIQSKLSALQIMNFSFAEGQPTLNILTNMDTLNKLVKRDWKTLFGNSHYYSSFSPPFRAKPKTLGNSGLVISENEIAYKK